jgi:Ca2+-binding RTX toxin-like protein
VGRVIIFGQAGDDRIEIRDDLALDGLLFGDAGHDKLIGGNGDDVLDGGAGDDRLEGTGGRDILIGGEGGDRLHGQDNNDILIAGFTDHDRSLAALDAILAEWRSDRSYPQRVANLRGTGLEPRLNGTVYLNAATVHDEGLRDRLFGEDGRDWFLANLDGEGLAESDVIDDQQSNEFADDLNW